MLLKLRAREEMAKNRAGTTFYLYKTFRGSANPGIMNTVQYYCYLYTVLYRLHTAQGRRESTVLEVVFCQQAGLEEPHNAQRSPRRASKVGRRGSVTPSSAAS